MNRIFLSLLIVSLLGAANAEAKPRHAVSNTPETFNVDIPTGQVDIGGEIKRSEMTKDPVDYEISVSNWRPLNYSRSSYSAITSDFHRGSVPFLSINRIASLKRLAEDSGIFYRLGISYVSIERDGFSQVSNGTFLSTQTLNLTFVRAGVEYRTKSLWAQLVQPYLGVALLPALALGAQSPFEEKVSDLGVPFELYGGVLFRPRFLDEFLDLGDGSLGIAGHYTFGSLAGSSMSGLGLQAIVQISL